MTTPTKAAAENGWHLVVDHGNGAEFIYCGDELIPFDKYHLIEKHNESISKLTREMQPLREALEKLNGWRNVMANAFNQYAAARDHVKSQQAAAEMFWNADSEFNTVISTALAGQPVTPSRDGLREAVQNVCRLLPLHNTNCGCTTCEAKRQLRTALEMEKV